MDGSLMSAAYANMKYGPNTCVTVNRCTHTFVFCRLPCFLNDLFFSVLSFCKRKSMKSTKTVSNWSAGKVLAQTSVPA